MVSLDTTYYTIWQNYMRLHKYSQIVIVSRYTKNLLSRKCGCSNLQNISQHPQSCGQPLQMCLIDSGRIYRPNKNVTVNPLPPKCNQLGTGVPKRNLDTKINKSHVSDRSPDNSISNIDFNQRNIDQDTEPVYAEIASKKIDKSEVESKEIQSGLEKQHKNTKGKKEIEYWQITAKEVVKFRPCTETFIVRE